jgi:hypothetical protein
MAVAEEAIDAFDAVLGEGGTAQVAAQVGHRQFPTADERLDDRGERGGARRVNRRARPSQPPP